ncbi:hypothetical protein GCM10027048_28080 [Hymenobacter coalescens]
MKHPAYTLLADLRTKFAEYFTERQLAYLRAMHGKEAANRIAVLAQAALRTVPDLESMHGPAATNWQLIGLEQLASEYRSAVLWGAGLTSERADCLLTEARLIDCPAQLLKKCADAWSARNKASEAQTVAKTYRGGFPLDPNELHASLPDADEQQHAA